MENSQKLSKNSKAVTSTAIRIVVKEGSVVDWMDIGLPRPQEWHHIQIDAPYALIYTIDGYFGTSSGKEYLHDTAAKIAYALNGTYDIIQNFPGDGAYKLMDFDHLERPLSFNQQLELNAMNGSRDEIFDALRHKAYEMARTGTLDLEALETYGNRITQRSAHVKYLAKNIVSWVEANYVPRPQPRMTKTEAAALATKVRSDRTRKTIFSALNFLNSFDQINKSQLSRAAKVSRTSFYKYLRIWQELRDAAKMLSCVSTPYGNVVDTLAEVLKKVVFWHTLPSNEGCCAAQKVSTAGFGPP